MKNNLPLLFLLLSFVSFSQQQNQDSYNSITLGADFSSNIFLGDIKQHDFYPSRLGNFNEFRFSGAVNARKMFNNVYGLQAEFGIGKLAGIRRQHGSCDFCEAYYDPAIDTISTKFLAKYRNFDLSIVANLSNFIVKPTAKRQSKIKLLGEIGAGLISFNSTLKKVENNELLAFRGYENESLETEKNQSEGYFKLATNIIYPITNRLDLNAKIKYYIINSDDIDLVKYSGRDVVMSTSDKFLSFSLGLSYTIGKKQESLHWYNPLNELYNNQIDINNEMQKISTDTDKDGVSDYFDKHPKTSQGIQVDGSGVPLDVDGDGVYDYKDKDLLTSKKVSVNSDGKEIDSDKDGVPDSRDVENSKIGSLVNFKGKTIYKDPNQSTSTRGRLSSLPTLYFSSSSDIIRKEEFKTLSEVSKVINANPHTEYYVVGHADSRGSIEYNDKLALKRAERTVDYLVNIFGVDSNRLEPISKGETSPLLYNLVTDSVESKNQVYIEGFMNEVNRRVEFIPKK